MFFVSEILESLDWVIVTILLTFFLYYYGTNTFNYFEKLGIKYVKPIPFFGNTIQSTLNIKHFVLCHKDIYEKSKGEDLIGFFDNKIPLLMVRSPQLLQNIFVTDFKHFYDRGRNIDEKLDPLRGYSLTNLTGQKWKYLRQKLTPTFSSGKLKMMFQSFNDCSKELQRYFNDFDQKPINAIEAMQKYAIEVIGLCVFGLQFNVLRDPNSIFYKLGKEISEPSFARKITPILVAIHSNLPSLINFRLIKQGYYKFFLNFVNDIIQNRKNNNIERNDYIQLLMDITKQDSKMAAESDGDNKIFQESKVQDGEFLKAKSDDKFILDNDILAANTYTFFSTGFETISLTLSYCLYELSMRQNIHIQKRLREEIITILKQHDNKVTLESVKEMPYLDCVISETLRKYPVAGVTLRICTSPYHIKGTSITLKKGQKLLIPIYSIHHDPEYYPEPDVFDPERFTDENKLKRPFFSYLPFGGGPRTCIAARFSLCEIKAALANIIPRYEITMNEKSQVPLQWNPRKMTLGTKNTIYLNFKPIKEEY